MIKTNIFRQYEGNKKIMMYKLKGQFTLGTYNDKFIQQNFKEYKVISDKIYSNKKYNCFNYALKLSFLLFVEDTIDILFEQYKQINLKDIQKGDIIALADEYNFLHFVKVIKIGNNINDIIGRGKFGRLNIYEHKLIDTPLDLGDRFIIFRGS